MSVRTIKAEDADDEVTEEAPSTGEVMAIMTPEIRTVGLCGEIDEEKIAEVDIISCATLSKIPLVLGKYLKTGQHIDLVGAYKTDMREADDETISKASVYVDTFQGALKESGDIVIPLQNKTYPERVSVSLQKHIVYYCETYFFVSRKSRSANNVTHI